MTITQRLALTVAACTCVLLSARLGAGRYEGYTQRAAQGPKATVVCATYFGGPGVEEFVAGGGQKDGTVIAFGNAWGPEFAEVPDVKVLGQGKHSGGTGLKEILVKTEKTLVPDLASPDRSGMVVFYAPKMTKVKSAVRMDWGVGSITTGLVLPDDKLIIAGHCGPNFASFESLAAQKNRLAAGTEPAPTRKGKGVAAAPSSPGPAYIARLSANGQAVEWVWVLASSADIARLWTDYKGSVYFAAGAFLKIASDGSTATPILATADDEGRTAVRCVDPNDGSVFVGGDRNTSLGKGKGPWRQPIFEKFDSTGKRLWSMWNWPSHGLLDPSIKSVRTKDGKTAEYSMAALQGDVSDTAIRVADFSLDGKTIVIGAWSDGGNTIITKQWNDGSKRVREAGIGFGASGMKGANSLAHVVQIDPKTKVTNWHGLFLAYLPQNFIEAEKAGAPNFISTDQLRVLRDNAFATVGRANTGLIQTPNAFWKDPLDGKKYGGPFAAVFSPGMNGILFSSYFPGCKDLAVAPYAEGAVVTSCSAGTDGRKDEEGKDISTGSPSVNALQAEIKGKFDAHIVVLDVPPMAKLPAVGD